MHADFLFMEYFFMPAKKIQWKSIFTPTIRSRALQYYRSGKVKKLVDEGNGDFSATVRGSRNYQVIVHLEDNEVDEMSCTCPYSLTGAPCKHEAAMLYLMEDQGYLDIKEEAEELPADPFARFDFSSRTEDEKQANSPSSEKNNIVDFHPPVSSKKEKLLAAHEASLQELVQKDVTESDTDEDADSFVVDNYHYYDGKAMLNAAHIPDKVLKEAVDQLFTKNPPHIYGFSDPYFSPADRNNSRRDCLVINKDGNGSVRLTITRKRIEQCTCTECYYTKIDSKSSFGHVPCIHQAAAIVLLSQYLDEEDLTDSTDKSARGFLSAALGPKTGRAENTSAAGKNAGIPLHMEVRLETPQNERDLFAAFYIGTGRFYKVRDLEKLLEGFQNRDTQTFGKNTELYLSEDSLDEKSKKWYQWLKQEHGQFEKMMDRLRGTEKFPWGYSYNNLFTFPTTLVLDEERMDSFFDLQKGAPLEYTDRSLGFTDKYHLHLAEGKLNLNLTIVADYSQANTSGGSKSSKGMFEGISINGSMVHLLVGRKYIYQMTDTALIRVDQKYPELVRALAEACGPFGIDMKIGRTRLNDFWHHILPKLREIASVVVIGEDDIEKYIVPDPEYHFYLDEQDSTIYGQAEVSYGSARYSLGDWDYYANNKIVTEGFRKRSGETEVYERFSHYLPEYDATHKVFSGEFSDDEMFNFLDSGLSELMDIGEVQVTEQFKRLRVRRSVPMQVGVSLNSGLMDLSVSSDDVSPEELIDILAAYKKKSHYYRLKSGDFLKLDNNETVESLEQMMNEMHLSLKDFVSGHMQLPAYRALYLEHMLSGLEDVYANRDSHFRSLVRAFKSVEDAEYQLPEDLHAKLRAYQEDGYRWLRTLDEWNFGGILADEMGLGKTLQVITCVLAVHEGTSLVVCPASLVYNWGEEIKKFAPALRTILVSGTAAERKKMIGSLEDYDIAVTSYDLLKRDIDQYDGHEFRFAVVDEAQNLKNPMTAAAKSVKLLKAKTRLALTGTPIENRLSELWSIFDFIMPGYLYDYRTFKEEMESPIAKNQDEEATEHLKRMVSPFILRRQKKDVLKDLPEKLEEVRYARMEKKQQLVYDAEVAKMKKLLVSQSEEEFRHSKIQVLAELTKIREICCNPELLFENYDGESAKTEMCLELIHSLIEGQHRTLIFSQFTSMFLILEDILKKEGISYYKITGETPKKERLELVNAFNSDTTPLFLISLKAGGTGLNLTGADVVIHYDPWWNLAAQNQATDRAHRIGQTKTVTVFKLIVKDTIEEKILDLQESKKKLADDILGGEGISSSALNREDLMDLLG